MGRALDVERQSRLQWVASLLGVPAEEVTLSDSIEPVEPDFKKCGAGRGSQCCVFLVMGPWGFQCARKGPLDSGIRRSVPRLKAKRIPTEDYPGCMIFEGEIRGRSCPIKAIMNTEGRVK